MPCGLDEYQSCSCQPYRMWLEKLIQDMCYLTAMLDEEGLLGKYGNPRIVKWHNLHHQRDYARVFRTVGGMILKKKLSAREIQEKLIKRGERVHPVSRFHKKWFLTVAEDAIKAYNKCRKEKEGKFTQALNTYNKFSKSERDAVGAKKPEHEQIEIDDFCPPKISPRHEFGEKPRKLVGGEDYWSSIGISDNHFKDE